MRNRKPTGRAILTRSPRFTTLCSLLGLCLLVPVGCDEEVSSVDTPATQTLPPIRAQEMSLFEVQVRVQTLIKIDQYDDAIALLNSMDMPTYIKEGVLAGPEGRPQYWAVKEDGLDLPYIQTVESLSEKDRLQIELDAWVVPGTNDTPATDIEKAWQQTATAVATKYNTALYAAVLEEK